MQSVLIQSQTSMVLELSQMVIILEFGCVRFVRIRRRIVGIERFSYNSQYTITILQTFTF